MKYNLTELTKQANKLRRKRERILKELKQTEKEMSKLLNRNSVKLCYKCKNYVDKKSIEPQYNSKIESLISNPHDWMNKYEYEDWEIFYKEFKCPICGYILHKEKLTANKVRE